MYTLITHFVGSFLQQVIGILGHTMCLYLVFWTNHILALHPGKPKNNTTAAFEKLPRRPSGAVVSTPKTKTLLNSLNLFFQRGRSKTWAQATIWTLWFQFTQGDRHSINPCKDLGSIQVVQLDGRNGWLGLDLKRKKMRRAFKALEKLAIHRCFRLAHDMYVYIYILYIYLDKNLKNTYKFI